MNLFRLAPFILFLITGLASMAAFATSSDTRANSDGSASKAAVSQTQTLTPEKSPNDDRQYRYQTLENGLEVLLISDPDAKKGAAALDVQAGSGDEPDDRPGIAHFLEHMLFLGTEKYPDAGEYQQYISNHGGSHNAYTAFQDTNYFFDVNAEFLEPALDRFAQQFVAPAFNPELVERERNAVHSEYSSKLQDDGRRFFSAFKEALNPEHRYTRFSVGNLTTLDDADGTLRQDVVDFYKKHYHAGAMTLVVYGPQSLDTLADWVKTRFDALPTGPSDAYKHKEPLLKSDNLPKLLEVEALKDSRRLQLSFPIDSVQAEYQRKPGGYVGHMVGHEGAGSLTDVLKQAGLVNGLSAGVGTDTGENALFQISLNLTQDGLENWRDAVALTFDYIEQVREKGIAREYFEEQQRLAEISFRFAEKSEPIRLVSRLAGSLHHVRPEDILKAPYMMEEYAPEQYQAILDRLRPDNVLVSILAPGIVGEEPQRTSWYQTAYELESLKPADLKDAGDLADLREQLTMPEPNPFIPEDLELVAGENHDQPIRLTSEPFTLWYGRDTSFGTPRANVYLSLRSPAARGDASDSMLTQLWVESVKDQINAFAYAAQLAGLDYSVYSHLRGVTLRVSGYSDKLDKLLDRLLSTTLDPQLQESRFEIHRRQLIESLENARKDKPYNQALGLLSEKLIEDLWPREERLEAARELTFADLQAFVPRFLSKLDPVMLAHGNLTPDASKALGQTVARRLPEKTDFVDVSRSDVRRLDAGSNHTVLPVKHDDTGYARYLQGQETSYANRAAYRLLSQLVSTPFYHALRTEQQLGYIVFANSYELLEVPGLAFVIQSPVADGEKLDRQVQQFLENYGNTLENMSESELLRQKSSVITRLLEEEKTLRAISERWWREIDRENHDFDTREQLVDAVKALDLKTIQQLYASEVEPLSRSLLITTESRDSPVDQDEDFEIETTEAE